MKKLISAIFSLAVITGFLVSAEAEGPICRPVTWKGSILFTDNRASALYILKDSEAIVIAEGRGIGYHLSQSPVNKALGSKIILDNGLQVPVLIHPGEKDPEFLQQPVREAGQVSFTSEGIAAWTSGKRLHLTDGRSCELPAYANLAPVSPDGMYVVSNDDTDHLWLTHIDTETRKRVSPAINTGFFQPQWSPNGESILFSTLGGTLWLYTMKDGSVFELTQGFEPVWKDEETILFHRIDVEMGTAVNADIYSCNIRTGTVENLTRTQNRFEMDPSWDQNRQRILYHTREAGEIATLSTVKGETVLFTLSEALPARYYPSPSSTKSAVFFEIPYVNQVYDPPDWFGAGSAACGGTSAVMCLAYYGTIDPWPATASNPYPHESPYGRYICDKYYTILGYNMDRIGYSRGNHGWGAFGYITQNNWTDTKGYMAEYAWKNGMANKPVDWSPTRTEVIQQVDQRMPFVLLNSLTSSGHYITTIGYENNSATTLIFNDPYGNKNTPGYPSYDGVLARYDWPGYNNGYQNLNKTHCFIYFQSDIPQKTDIALENLSNICDTLITGSMILNEILISNKGDTLFKPTKVKYKLYDYGVNNLNIDTVFYTEIIKSMFPNSKMHFKHYLQLPDSLVSDTYLFTVEVPVDPGFGEIRLTNNVYQKEVKIIGYPHVYATAPEMDATVNSTTPVLFAKFRETIDKVNTDSVFLSLNGVNINDECSWNTREIRRIDETPLEPGEYTAEVRVRNLAAGHESVYSWNFTLTSTALEPDKTHPGAFDLAVYPNPFNPEGTLHFTLPKGGDVLISIFDIRGGHIKTLSEGYYSAGKHTLTWDGTNDTGHPVKSGLYIVRLMSPSGIKTTRLVLLK